MRTVDLNADLGEGFGTWQRGDDAAMLGIVTSANVACGFHAGDPEVMAATFRAAKACGVSVGAHPGYADLPGFGRRAMVHSAGEIERLVAYQVGAALGVSAAAGHRITHVKPHGALANLAQADATVAAAVTRGIRAADPGLVCLAMALGQQERIAREMGMAVRSEIFADRSYLDDGALMPRDVAGAVIDDPALAAARVLRCVQRQVIETASGLHLPVVIDSVCVHGDTPGAVAMAAAIRAALTGAGISVRAFA